MSKVPKFDVKFFIPEMIPSFLVYLIGRLIQGKVKKYANR